jgi:NADPH:quinone reductase
VWVYGAQSYRPFGTAAQFTVIPEYLAVPLPDGLGDDVGAALGIPGITAHRAVFSDGSVDGKTLLVHGMLGGVSSLAAQLARWGGATVIATVTRSSDLASVDPAVVAHAVALDQSDPAGAIREFAPKGVDRIVEVAFSDNADLDAAVVGNDAVIAAYATRADRPEFPFWPMLFANVTIRLLGSDDFPAEAKQQAARPSPARQPPAHCMSRSASLTRYTGSPTLTTTSTPAPAAASSLTSRNSHGPGPPPE